MYHCHDYFWPLQSLCLCLCSYRPPSSGIEFFDSLYNALCSLDVDLFSNFILIGDFIIAFLLQTRQYFSQLLNITTSFDSIRLSLVLYTHFSHLRSPSIIDLAFLSRAQNLISCCTIYTTCINVWSLIGLFIICKLPAQFKRPKYLNNLSCVTRGDFQKVS